MQLAENEESMNSKAEIIDHLKSTFPFREKMRKSGFAAGHIIQKFPKLLEFFGEMVILK